MAQLDFTGTSREKKRQLDFTGTSREKKRQLDFTGTSREKKRQLDFTGTSKAKPVQPAREKADFVSEIFAPTEFPVKGVEKIAKAIPEYTEIAGKAVAREAITAIPKTALAGEVIKEKTFEEAEKLAEKTIIPERPSGLSLLEQAKVAKAIREGKADDPEIAELLKKAEAAPTITKAREPAISPLTAPLQRGVEAVEEKLAVDTEGDRGKQIVEQAAGAFGRMVGTGFNLTLLAAGAGTEKGAATIKEGEPLSKALVAGTIQGLTEYFTERIPLRILKEGGASMLNRLVRGLAHDAPGEVAATLVEMGIIDEALLGKEYSWADYKRAIEDTLITSGLMTAGGTVITHPFLAPRVEKPGPPPVEPAPPLRETAELLPPEVREQVPSSKQVLAEHEGKLTEEKKRLDQLEKQLKKKPDIVSQSAIKKNIARQEKTVATQEKLVDSVKKELVEEPTLDQELIEAERAPTAAESVVSDLLPVDRTKERGAITINDPTPPVDTPAPVKQRVKGLINSFREFWQPLSTIPQSEQYLAGRYRTLGKLYQVDRIVKKVKTQTDTLSPEGKYDVFRYLNGEIPVESLSEKQAFIANQVQNTFNTVGRMAVNRGILDEASYEKHKNQYVPYLYLRHVLDDTSSVTLSPSGRLDLSYTRQRAGLTKAQQRERGLIEDVSITAPIGIGRTLADVVKYDRFADIANNPKWTFAPSVVEIDGKKMGVGKLVEEIKIAESMNRQAPNVPEIQKRLSTLRTALDSVRKKTTSIPRDFAQMPVSKKWGDLSGAFVRKEVKRDIMQEGSRRNERSTSKILNAILDADAKAMAAFKVSKTALNPPTMFRNAVSNLIQQWMYGINPLQQPKNMLIAASTWKNRGKHLVEFERNGGFKTNWSIAEVNNVFDSVKTMQKQNDVVAGLKKMAGVYGKIDDFFKLNMFVHLRRKGVPVEKAMQDAQKWTMDYTLVHPVIQAARRHVAPMVTYLYKITSLAAETAVKRPWVIASLASAPLLMKELAKQKLDLTDEEFEEAEKELPSFIRKTGSYAPLLWRSKEGELQWVNMEYYFPWSGLASAGQDIAEEEYAELVRDIGISGPFIDIGAALLTKKKGDPLIDPFSKRPVYNRLDSPTDKALKLSEWVYNKWAPTILQRHGTLGKVKRIGTLDKYGREATVEQAISSLFGANIIAPTPEQGTIEKYVRVKALALDLVRIANDPNISDEEKDRAQEEYQRRIQAIMEGQN
jgi:hypothetical protein